MVMGFDNDSSCSWFFFFFENKQEVAVNQEYYKASCYLCSKELQGASKHELCREILIYQRKHKLTDEEMAKRMELTLAETQDILYYCITYFTLDRLATYAEKLFKTESLTIRIIKSKELHDKSKVI